MPCYTYKGFKKNASKMEDKARGMGGQKDKDERKVVQ
jgi:hypothetical protein